MASTTYRLSEDARQKVRIMAATQGISANEFVSRTIDKAIMDWEKARGDIKLLNE